MAGEYADLETKCTDSIEHFKRELTRMRSGRASTGLLEGLMVDYYGTQTPLQQLGLLNAPEARLITIQVYDTNAVESVEKAILQSDLGLNPSRDGNLIRINIPTLTEERRQELVKKINRMAEDAKVSIRNHRRDTIDSLKKQQKAKEISEDDLHRSMDDVQKIADDHIKGIETLLADKEKEMMEV